MKPPTVGLEGGFETSTTPTSPTAPSTCRPTASTATCRRGARNKAALIWEGDDGSTRTYTYQQLHHEVSRFANVLRKKGIERGDRVALYLPMIPELPIAMLACARVGAIHSVIFGGFSSSALRGRIQDCGAKLLITADEGIRGGRKVPLKAAPTRRSSSARASRRASWWCAWSG
jgi:acyl-coenzyme A synthetase/AMP-(fatty) acid ligase